MDPRSKIAGDTLVGGEGRKSRMTYVRTVVRNRTYVIICSKSFYFALDL